MTTPADLLATAKSIQASMPDETGQRTCVNRAYYAVYHAANEIDQRLQLPDPPEATRGSSHQRLYNRLANCPASCGANRLKVMSIGYTAMKLLKPFREHADYRIGEPIPATMPEEAVAKSALLLEKASSI